MSTVTKEWLLKTIAELEEERDAVPGIVNEDAAMALAAMKLALASLEAESKPRQPELSHVIYHFRDWNEGFPVERFKADYVISWMLANYPPAQPAAVSVPDDVSGPLAHAYKELTPTFMRNHIDVFERYGIYPDGSAGIQAMRIALDGMNRRAAMLQGAEPVTTAYKLPFEQWLSQQTGTIDVECGCVMTEVFFHWLRVAYEAGNSPVIPDGWVMVPIEPTEHMIVNGFESEPDESFSDEKEWEAYEAMSGCQQAAHRAKLCWAAMIVAAQKLRKQ
ncbi:hypothetical protein [Enterobacter hormaechei]|uniref:hypothetical protein n=1 Tax=Enterobacter hormaechei TaxID=158836 RepID=UPI00125C2517|nr:hypothetical protein [Enterobacter hormaechei]VAE12554.1 Uncharacterised protein [Enterobacter hormaechei]VAF53665.1 Uncharacterised protein [Enterobacter hormaechei]